MNGPARGRAAVHQHVQKLYDNGVITGSGFQVDPKMLGYNLCLYVGITLEKGSLTSLQKVWHLTPDLTTIRKLLHVRVQGKM